MKTVYNSKVTPLNPREPVEDHVLVAKERVHESLDDRTDNEEPEVATGGYQKFLESYLPIYLDSFHNLRLCFQRIGPWPILS